MCDKAKGDNCRIMLLGEQFRKTEGVLLKFRGSTSRKQNFSTLDKEVSHTWTRIFTRIFVAAVFIAVK